ncbi:MAG: hypothetical protein LBS36_12115 [Oscillospiraceae bacterium]|jgi:ABC-2 type transport system permease protein|nr:hypothetical protein [Oscillospiraceae bacterium]
MLKQLILIRLSAFWDSMMRGRNRSQAKKTSGMAGAGKKLLIAVFAVYIVASLGFSVGMMFKQMADQLVPMNLGWIYFLYLAVAVLLFNFVGSIFAVYSQIYDAKDNDLLLSMPIPPRYILLSRILSVLVLNYIYAAIFALPAGIVYFTTARVGVLHVAFFVIATLALPLLAVSVSCLVGWLIGLITIHFKRKNLISSFFMLLFFGFYMVFMMNFNTYLQRLLANAEDIGRTLSRALPPAYSYGMAIAQADVMHLLLVLAFCVIPFLIVYLVLSKSFVKVATTKKGGVKVAYVEKEMKTGTAQTALLKKEWARFSSLPAYIMNSALGVLFEILLAGYVLINADKVLLMVSQAIPLNYDGRDILPLGICLLLGLLSVMNFTTAPALSLEGKNLQLLQSLPVRPIDIFNAKIKLNIYVGLPSIVISGVACWIAFGLTPVQGLFAVLLPAAVQSFIAVFGMFANILLPRFDWRNETVAIKQSASVLLTMFGGVAVFAAPAVLGLWLLKMLSVEAILAILCAVFALLTAGIYQFIRTKGQDKFRYM